MNDIHGEVGIDVERLRAADPDGLYLFMLEDYPYMMTSAQVAEFTCATSQEVRRLLARGELKGCRVGGAEVSPKHAGFVVNVGGATCADVLALIEKVRKTVYDAHGVMLEPEVKIIR